eukprot:2479224-Pyramimonas_sp.AAC.1
MDYRLLHCAAYGGTWYGRWGYLFGRGSFGATWDTWRRAVDTVQVGGRAAHPLSQRTPGTHTRFPSVHPEHTPAFPAYTRSTHPFLQRTPGAHTRFSS